MSSHTSGRVSLRNGWQLERMQRGAVPPDFGRAMQHADPKLESSLTPLGRRLLGTEPWPLNSEEGEGESRQPGAPPNDGAPPLVLG